MASASTPSMQLPDGVVPCVPASALDSMQPPLNALHYNNGCSLEFQAPVPDFGSLEPNPQTAALLGLSKDQLAQITGLRPQPRRPPTGADQWRHADRWQAQPILDFLFLGPSNKAHDAVFLQENRITKVVAVRDSRFADLRMLHYDVLVKKLGVASACFDVSTVQALIGTMPEIIMAINEHMLAAPVDADGASTGRVLVFCETGSLRSAAVVLAYIAVMYGERVAIAHAHAVARRFCIALDVEHKEMLKSYEQLLIAQHNVLDGQAGQVDRADTPNATSRKRSIEETVDEDDARHAPREKKTADTLSLNLDGARYENRTLVAPFVDLNSV